MGTINTSIRLRTSDSLPSSLSLAANTVGTVDNFTEYGSMVVGPIIDEIFTNVGVLSTKLCGPKGAYVFVENPSTNKYPVKLYGLQQITEEFAETTFEGIESFATLQPGDSTLVPLSAQQGGVVAASTFGTCEIKYYIADRGGDFGKSAIVVSDDGSYYTYFVLDAELGEPLPSLGVPTYGKSTTVSSSWVYDYAEIVNDKGYVLRFFDSGNTDIQKRVFIDSRGEIVETLALDYSEFIYNQTSLNGRGYFIGYMDGSDAKIYNFDGDSVHLLVTTCTNFTLWNDWDYTSADGSFIVEFTNYLGVTGDSGIVVVNKGSQYLLSNLNFGNTDKYVDDCAVYSFSTFIFLSIWDDNNSKYSNFQIWNTSGTLLKEIDVADKNFTIREWTFYGTNKLQLIAYNDTFSPHNEYLYNWNGTTNNLTEAQFEIGGTYTERKFYSYSKWITDSIRPWDYVWNSGQFEPESVVIVYEDKLDTFNQQINYRVSYLSFVYMLDGDTDYTTYEYANDEVKYLWLPSPGGGYYRFYTQKNSFVFNVSTGDSTTGALQALTFSKTGQKLTTIISDISAISGYSFGYKPVGDYVMYNWYTPEGSTTTYTMLYDEAGKGVRKDSVNIAGDQTYDGVWRMRFNTLLLRSWNYNSPRVWYFNTSANRFVELTNGGDAYSADKPYYSRHRFNKSVVTSGINDGNILLGPNTGVISAANENNNIRLLKKGLATKNITIPETAGDWDLMLGSDMVIYWYQDTNNSDYLVINAYDLDLNLVRTINLDVTTFSVNPVTLGKRCYFKTEPDQYKHYMLSSAGVAYMESDSAYGTDVVFNDYYWWDFQY